MRTGRNSREENGTKIFCGNANPVLAKQVCRTLRMKCGKAEIAHFSDGEIRVEIMEHVRDCEVFVIQPTCSPTNDNLMELLIMIDALRRSGAGRIVAVMPYYGYARQDRRPGFSRVPVTSRLIADMIQTAGADYVIVIDIHSKQQQGFFSIPSINISTSPVIVGDIWRNYMHEQGDTIIVSPDVGGAARARAVAKQLDNCDIAIVDKRREAANQSEVMNVIGDVDGKHCVIVDDMIDTGGTLAKAAIALKEMGAKTVAAYCTHPVFSGKAFYNMANSELDEVVVSDTIPLSDQFQNLKKVRVLSISAILSETIRRISSGESVSEIYMDE